MKTCILIIFSLVISTNAFAFVVNGAHTITKLGINGAQVNIILNNGLACYLVDTQPHYKETVALLMTLYSTGKTGFFRCSETGRAISPWEPGTAYQLLELSGL